ncbi:MAG TPA: J domain-containing protein [Bryobacteraceae bacterium]|nr:J domain-containing protein [Bryobacteraceae bacterium]
MDYYEELGLPRTAPVQEIRQAYKVLARLVHPDGQANQQAREMAERQMKRLNQILATLTDEQARREYDARLEIAGRQFPAAGSVSVSKWRGLDARIVWLPGWLRPVAENWFWISLALVVMGVGAWYLVQLHAENRASAALPLVPTFQPSGAFRRAPSRLTAPVRRSASTITPKPGKPPRQVQTADLGAPKTLENGKDAALPPTEEARVPANPPATQIPDTLRPAPAIPPPSSSAVPAKPPDSPFAGNWLYVPDPTENSRPGVYPAKYVELFMGEDHGRLRGTYRAEYQVLDRAVSPEVTFTLEGDSPPGISAHLKWAAADGAKGDVDLALAGPNLLKITWWTTEFGRHPKLASGTSKLVRQQAP